MIKVSSLLNPRISYCKLQSVLVWLLITAGAVKPVFEYLAVPVDWTLVVFCLVSLDIVFLTIYFRSAIFLSKEKVFSILLLFLFTLFILLSLAYTPSPSYGLEKTILFGVCLLFFIYPLFVRGLDLNMLNRLYIFIIIPIVIWFIVSKYLYFSPFNTGERFVRVEFYDIRRKYLGLGMVICFFTLVQVHLRKSPLWIVASVILLLGLGSRGSLFFLLLTLLIWKWKEVVRVFLGGIRMRKKLFKSALMVSLFLAPVLIWKFEQLKQVMYLGLFRFQSLLDSGTDISSLGRIERFIFSIQTIFSSAATFFLGNGIGSFGLLYTGEDIREYPHNVFLEIWFELGVFALLNFSLFLIAPFFFRRPDLIKALAICFLLHAMKSGDLVGLWLLFFAYGMMVFNPRLVYADK